MPTIHSLKYLLITLILMTISACSSFKGKALDYETIPTSSNNRSIEYGVYTPPNWTKTEKLPLVLLLHGALDSHTSFEKHQVHQYFDNQINQKKMPRIILVTPNGDNGFWENWYDGTRNYRDWVLKDVLPKVKKDYNTLDCPKHCHLAGISMGGFGALRFAYFSKNTFSSVSAISAPILNNEDNKTSKIPLMVRLLFPLKRIFGPDLSKRYKAQSIQRVWSNKNNTDLYNTRLQLIWGNKDRPAILSSNQRFHKLLKKTGRAHDHFIYQGGHKWKDWTPNLNRAINFLVKQ